MDPPPPPRPSVRLGLDTFSQKNFNATFSLIIFGVDNNQLPARFSQEEVSTALVPIVSTPPPNCPRLPLYKFYVCDLYTYIYFSKSFLLRVYKIYIMMILLLRLRGGVSWTRGLLWSRRRICSKYFFLKKTHGYISTWELILINSGSDLKMIILKK